MPPWRDNRLVVINTISGGIEWGKWRNKRKELARKARHDICAMQVRSSTYSISFSDADLKGVHFPHNDALVVSPMINHVWVRRMLIDIWRSVRQYPILDNLHCLWVDQDTVEEESDSLGRIRWGDSHARKLHRSSDNYWPRWHPSHENCWVHSGGWQVCL